MLVPAADGNVSIRRTHRYRETFLEVLFFLSIPAVGCRFCKEFDKSIVEVRQLDTVLGPFWAGNGRVDRLKVEVQNGSVIDLVLGRNAEHLLSDVIVADRVDVGIGTARVAKIIERFFVDREKSHRR